jgi:hypothetical protein
VRVLFIFSRSFSLQTPEFVFMGYGYCLSSSNHTYDQYTIDGGGSDPNICSRYCLKHEGFVGFTIRDIRWCDCFYESGFFPKPCPTNRCITGRSGVGNVTYTDGSANIVKCYKYQWDLFGMPSARPSVSSQPSYLPSVSVQPSISSHQPSAQPSFSPSSSLVHDEGI